MRCWFLCFKEEAGEDRDAVNRRRLHGLHQDGPGRLSGAAADAADGLHLSHHRGRHEVGEQENRKIGLQRQQEQRDGEPGEDGHRCTGWRPGERTGVCRLSAGAGTCARCAES